MERSGLCPRRATGAVGVGMAAPGGWPGSALAQALPRVAQAGRSADFADVLTGCDLSPQHGLGLLGLRKLPSLDLDRLCFHGQCEQRLELGADGFPLNGIIQ